VSSFASNKLTSACPVCSGCLAGVGGELMVGGWGVMSYEPEVALGCHRRCVAAVVAEHVLIEVDG
jgi:hypothetical protein